jgi:hypothetical protein
VNFRLKPQRLALAGRKRSQPDDGEEPEEDQEDALNYGMFVHLVSASHPKGVLRICAARPAPVHLTGVLGCSLRS